VLIDPADAVIMLLHHQNGLLQTVKHVPVAEMRTNTVGAFDAKRDEAVGGAGARARPRVDP
jgi:hypothetical protein